MAKAEFTIRKDRKLPQGFPIILYVRLSNTKLRFYTDVFIKNPKYLEGNVISKKDKLCIEKNNRLTYILSEANIIILREADANIIKERINELLGHEVKKEKVLVDYILEFLKTKTNKRTIDSYRNTIRKIEGFDAKVTIEEIDIKWLNSFVRHCSKNHVYQWLLWTPEEPKGRIQLPCPRRGNR